jgi:Uma2 family endonuclease
MNEWVRPPTPIKGADGFPRRAFTTKEIFAMMESGIIKENERFELINGEVIPMSPKYAPHEWIKYRLTQSLSIAGGVDWFVAVETTVYLTPNTFVEPDLCLVPATLGVEHPKPDGIALVIEVADSSKAYDEKIKSPLYAKHGFAEYWLIDAKKRSTSIRRKPVNGAWTERFEVAADGELTFDQLPNLSICFAKMK